MSVTFFLVFKSNILLQMQRVGLFTDVIKMETKQNTPYNPILSRIYRGSKGQKESEEDKNLERYRIKMR